MATLSVLVNADATVRVYDEARGVTRRVGEGGAVSDAAAVESPTTAEPGDCINKQDAKDDGEYEQDLAEAT